MEPNLLPSKEPVDMFQGQISCLGVAEVYEWEDAEIENAEIDIRPPSNIPNTDRCDLHDKKSEDPV